MFVSELAGGDVILGVFVLRRLVDGKEKDLTSSSVHLYRRRIILGKIPSAMELRDGRTMASEVAAAVGI